jgi:divalent metal cation (Fe/Co/Zn/Cd) transporter
MVLLEDTAALLGIVIATLATVAVTQLHLRYMDGVGSVLIGLILGTIAVALAQESKSLLIGEQADPALRTAIAEIAKRVSSVEDAEVVFAVQLAPEQVVVALGVRFPDDLTAVDIAKQIHEIERAVRQRHPEVMGVYVRPRDDA